MKRALLSVFPSLADRVPWVELGVFPTPVESVRDGLYVKRDDQSSPIYGGNKVRTLEVLFASALREGATRMHATGAYGSNHATATVLHAPRVGLEPGVILFPQPRSPAALENLRVMLAARPRAIDLPHWAALPFGIERARRGDRRDGLKGAVMIPGGATPAGALGYVSAALELAQQVEEGVMPAPREVVVGVGSTCTSAGLLLGMRIAAELGLGWRTPPRLVSVRVTPWPVTAAFRIVRLAKRTAAHLAALTHEPRWAALSGLASGLLVEGRYLGRGYGLATPEGRAAIEAWRTLAGFELDTTYSAKAVACVLARTGPGPRIYWSTKSTARLPDLPLDLDAVPPRMRRWIASFSP